MPVRRVLTVIGTTVRLWIDSHSHDPNAKHLSTVYATPEAAAEGKARSESMDWFRCIPFILVHLVCFAVIWVGCSWAAVGYALFLYLLRMHAITGWYHRYFSHRTFKTSRFWQFTWAFIGNTSAQRGPLWWAAHHRHHHRHSDEESDIHSPKQKGFWWSHMGWFTARANFRSQLELVPDLAKFPELIWLDRFDIFAPLMLGFASWGLGVALQHWAPSWGVTGWQMLVWFFISTVVTAHATFTINSLAHVFGARRFETTDTSRNSLLLSIITLGEGWHNNHHHYQSTVRQGFRWWELDVSWYLLVIQSWLGITRDLKGVPAHLLNGEPKPATATVEKRGSTSSFVTPILKPSEPAA
jgi:stearoyl-CoA desaturase (delta-9 desaturase)